MSDTDDDEFMQVADRNALPTDERFEREEARRMAQIAIDGLPRRLRHILKVYYGQGRTLRDIGTELGVTESRVCQLRSEAVKRLRGACAPATLAAA